MKKNFFNIILEFRIWLASLILPEERVFDRCIFTGQNFIGGRAIFTKCFFVENDKKLAKILEERADTCLYLLKQETAE